MNTSKYEVHIIKESMKDPNNRTPKIIIISSDRGVHISKVLKYINEEYTEQQEIKLIGEFKYSHVYEFISYKNGVGLLNGQTSPNDLIAFKCINLTKCEIIDEDKDDLPKLHLVTKELRLKDKDQMNPFNIEIELID